ncbi:MAG: DinB family protein [Bacteroidetes bacterium SW_9_63_38]|nr:MAG: DinB family protein [Bacteroidetes bacterium SW_9_63_38]
MDDTTDIEEAQAEDPSALRNALLDQLSYLVEEVEALRSVVEGLPDQIKNGRPAPDELTMKELYGAIATLDAEIRIDRVAQIIDADDPVFTTVDIDEHVRENGWNDRPMDDILDQVQDARHALLDRLRELPLDAWHRTATLDEDPTTLFDLVHRITQTDAGRLRDLGYRLHGAHLSEDDKPLPS